MEIDIEKEHVAFEAYFSDDGAFKREVERDGDSYAKQPAARAWDTWLAAKRHAAQVAEPANFCDRCGKRNIGIHTCTPPADVPAQPGIEPAPSGPSVPVPLNSDQAAGMVIIGQMWLKQNAPDRLKPSGASVDSDRLAYLLDAYDRAGEAAGAEYSAAYKAIVAHIDAWNASQMTARTAEVAQNAAALMKKMRPATVADMQSVDSVARDAARYRWLRDGASCNRVPHITQYPAQKFDKPRMPQIRDVGLDAAIDAAMSPTKAGEGV